MAKKKIQDITKKKELSKKETEKVKGGILPPKPAPQPKPGPGKPVCFCTNPCSVVGQVFGSQQRCVEGDAGTGPTS